MFITFEGADGAGKSTQLTLVKDYLIEHGREVITTREPGGTVLGQELREILLHHPGEFSSTAEFLIFLADRAQHVDTKIKPALENGTFVLCDRYIDSTVAYQGYGRGVDINKITMLNDIATSGLKPHKTFLFDIDTDTAMERILKTRTTDRMESTVEFHRKVAQGYLELARQNPERFIIIDARPSVEVIFEQVKEALTSFLR